VPPRFSIVTPVFDPPLEAFRSCASSVLAQTEHDWEWILIDDCSTNPKVREELRLLAASSAQVTVIERSSNGGIVAASNDGIARATGDFIVLLDHDDELTPDALHENSLVIDQHPTVDYLYSDEDKVNEAGVYYDTFSKPDWSPERLRGQNYCSHLSVLRTSLVREVGAFRPGFDGSQDYDLFLRVTEKARAIAHIPKVLYHWRTVAGSAALDPEAKPYALVAAQKAVQEHLNRVGISGTVETTPEFYLRTTRNLTRHPKVSIVIPTCGTAKRIWGRDMVLVETAVTSIVERSSYSNYEIVVVYDTPRTPNSVLQNLRSVVGTKLVEVPYGKAFNFSEKCNLGVVRSSGDIIILLNDDTQVFSPDWIEGLITFLDEPDVGMVGPLLLLEDGRIQSAGHFYNLGAHNAAFGLSPDERGPFSVLTMPAERSGLTMACVAIPRDVFDEVGGLCVEFPRAFNDVDFGNKLDARGYRMIWTPNVALHHFESVSRDPRVDDDEIQALWGRWGSVVLGRDRFLPNFDFTIHGIDPTVHR